MKTEGMKYIDKAGINKRIELFSRSKVLKEIAEYFNTNMGNALIRTQLIELIEANYDIGEVFDIYEIFGGYINRSFGIYTKHNDKREEYFVRKYRADITEDEICFEHSLINYAIEHGFSLAAGAILNRENNTYVKIGDEYYAIYRFLPGKDKYAWDNPGCNTLELKSSAEVLAQFHTVMVGFDANGLERNEPGIVEMLPLRLKAFKNFADRNINTKFHKYYRKKLLELENSFKEAQIPEEICRKLPRIACHHDYHPGNLKYDNDKVVGAFDFDWSNIDYRLFDICLGIIYFCSSWNAETDGEISFNKCYEFLDSYNETIHEMKAFLPITSEEKEYFFAMLSAANLYLLNWTITTYYESNNLNEYEYLAYLAHNIRLMKYIENNKPKLVNIVNSIN